VGLAATVSPWQEVLCRSQRKTVGADPRPDCEPSKHTQVAAMHKKKDPVG